MERIIISAASYYNRSYYLNPEFVNLPPQIKNDIKLSVIYAAENSRGIFTLGIYENGDIFFETGGMDDDLTYDEIEGKLQIKNFEAEKHELLKQLSLWFELR